MYMFLDPQGNEIARVPVETPWVDVLADACGYVAIFGCDVIVAKYGNYVTRIKARQAASVFLTVQDNAPFDTRNN